MVFDIGIWFIVKVYIYWINGFVKKMLSFYFEKRVCEIVFLRIIVWEMLNMM